MHRIECCCVAHNLKDYTCPWHLPACMGFVVCELAFPCVDGLLLCKIIRNSKAYVTECINTGSCMIHTHWFMHDHYPGIHARRSFSHVHKVIQPCSERAGYYLRAACRFQESIVAVLRSNLQIQGRSCLKSALEKYNLT